MNDSDETPPRVITADLYHSVAALKREADAMPADPARDAELRRRSVAGETSTEIADAMKLTKYYVIGRLRTLALMGDPKPRLCVDNARSD